VPEPADSPTAGDHYFSAEPTVASRPRTVVLRLPDLQLELLTDRGVFSGERVDPGTKLLLLEGPRPAPEARNLVDLGCGYGPIAIALARRAPQATVWAVEVNERARALCQRNAVAAGVGERVRAVAPEEVPADLLVDGLWSNPPIRIGKPALHELLRTWLPRLAPDSVAALVVAKNLGADSLSRWLAAEGHPVERLALGAGYRILAVGPAPSTLGHAPPTEEPPS
jgi:16S rRNA (guanine1207-N2)-methyltransferase